MNAYAEQRGYLMLDQLTVSDMDRFYASWKDGIRSKAKKLETLKSFIRFCRKREWIEQGYRRRSPGCRKVLPYRQTRCRSQMTELGRVCSRRATSLEVPTPQGGARVSVQSRMPRIFILLSIYTGLRISDVATFNI